mgnify:FL=1
MQFIDLQRQYQELEKEINKSIRNVLEHGKYIMGPEVHLLESELCDYTGSKYCLTCANGTDALQMALMALGIGPGDAVFVPSFTFMSTAEVVNLVGATPVFADIEIDSFNLDPESFEKAVKETLSKGILKPKAVIPVDLFGQCADYEKIESIAKKYGLFVIEDAAQGFGGSIKGRMACSFGDISTTSFFPAKPLGCYGDGGAVFTDNDEIFQLMSSIRVHGKGTMKYDNVRVGLNSRLDTIQAAILLPKLHAFISSELELRNKWADLYTELLKYKVRTPYVPNGYISSWAQYTILLDDSEQREHIQKNLKAKGIPTNVYYTKPLHLQTVYLPLGYPKGSLPFSEEASERVLSLPMHPYMAEEMVTEICTALLAEL